MKYVIQLEIQMEWMNTSSKFTICIISVSVNATVDLTHVFFAATLLPHSTGLGKYPSVGGCSEWVLAMVSSAAGEEMAFLHSSWPCYQDCWPTDLLYGSLFKFNPRWLKGDELPRDIPNGLCVNLLQRRDYSIIQIPVLICGMYGFHFSFRYQCIYVKL